MRSVTGERLSPEDYERHLADVLPTAKDRETLADIFTKNDWIAPKRPAVTP
ncbi:MAG: hypothetical protein HY340_00640 [Candidatus Kerfeldbacteria bacterium]|nr:hypothetical protein [Candidatus Kerfeldbacteria bacterium]